MFLLNKMEVRWIAVHMPLIAHVAILNLAAVHTGLVVYVSSISRFIRLVHMTLGEGKKSVLRANGFQKAVGWSGIILFIHFLPKLGLPKKNHDLFLARSLHSKFFVHVFVPKMADCTIFGSLKK